MTVPWYSIRDPKQRAIAKALDEHPDNEFVTLATHPDGSVELLNPATGEHMFRGAWGEFPFAKSSEGDRRFAHCLARWGFKRFIRRHVRGHMVDGIYLLLRNETGITAPVTFETAMCWYQACEIVRPSKTPAKSAGIQNDQTTQS